MRDFAILFAHLFTTIAKLVGPGGAKVSCSEEVRAFGEQRVR